MHYAIVGSLRYPAKHVVVYNDKHVSARFCVVDDFGDFADSSYVACAIYTESYYLDVDLEAAPAAVDSTLRRVDSAEGSDQPTLQ